MYELRLLGNGTLEIHLSVSSQEELDRCISDLEGKLTELHDASEHRFVDNGKGQCRTCGWYNPQGPKVVKDDKGKMFTLREAAADALRQLKNLEFIEVVAVIMIPQSRPWWMFWN